MALEVLRSLAQLKSECASKGIDVKISEPKEKKEDYVRALREFCIQRDFAGTLPKALELMISIECPMLCKRIQELKPEEQQDIWKSKSWYAERKIDGVRMVNIFTQGSVDFYSRNLSVTNYLPTSYKETIDVSHIDFSKITDEFIVDSELECTNPNVDTMLGKRGVVTESQLQAVTAILAMEPERSKEIQRAEGALRTVAFDCLWWNGEWLLDKPLIERRRYLKRAMEQMIAAGFNVKMPESSISNKEQFYKAIIFSGGEGVVFKNIYSPYTATSSRRRDGWVKCKRSMKETAQMIGADTIDGFITGYVQTDEEKGWSEHISGIEVSVYLDMEDGTRKIHPIARVSNIPREKMKEMTEIVNGQPVMKQKFYGQCVEVDGQCVSSRALRLKHAVLVRWRPDKSADQCIMEETYLRSMVL